MTVLLISWYSIVHSIEVTIITFEKSVILGL